MAYTKIHAIKATVNKAIDYICNPDKTDGNLLVSSFACSPDTAALDFRFTLSHTNQHDENKAYHLIQSFLPGEVSFEEAHCIGQELADKVLEGEYSYVVATHVDKDHVHNHIIFCAADNLEHNKYHDCKQTYYRIRKLSDELCADHKLSIISPGQERGKSYKEWQSNRNNTSWKTQIRKDINASIRSSANYEEFLLLMRAKGYDIAGDSLEGGAAKYITFRPLDKERPVRGSVKSLGKEYTKERISERIREQIEKRSKSRVLIPQKDYSRKTIIDTSDEKFRDSIGLQRWAAIENLKIASQTYNEVNTISQLEQKIDTLNETKKSVKQTLIKVEHRIKDLAEIIKYAEQYKTNRPYQLRYQKAKNPEAFFRKYESRLILYDGAKRVLRQKGLDTKTLHIDKLKTEYKELLLQKSNLTTTFKNCNKELRGLNHKLDNLNQYFDRDQAKQSPQQTPTVKKDNLIL